MQPIFSDLFLLEKHATNLQIQSQTTWKWQLTAQPETYLTHVHKYVYIQVAEIT